LNRSREEREEQDNMAAFFVRDYPSQKCRHGVSSIKENRLAIFMAGVLARHKIAKHYLDFPDFLNQWLNSFSSRSLRASVQTLNFSSSYTWLVGGVGDEQ